MRPWILPVQSRLLPSRPSDGSDGGKAPILLKTNTFGSSTYATGCAAAADVTITTSTDIRYPEARSILVVAIGLVLLFATYLALRTIVPRLMAVGLATFKSEIAQPVYLMLFVLVAVFLIISIFIPYHTFGEDIKMLKDTGLSVLKVACIFLAVWGASTTLSDEIEGRTALTVLSKPIGRRSFIVGKFMGIGWSVALMYLMLGIVLLAVVSFKAVYEARENSVTTPEWQQCFLEMAGTVPGLVLGLTEALVFAALSVAIATRLPMLANIMICFAVYGLGHLTPLIVQVTDEKFAIVKFFGTLIATVVPNLDSFDVQSAIDSGLAVRPEYMMWALVYGMTFCVVALFLALLLFEDRDVA